MHLGTFTVQIPDPAPTYIPEFSYNGATMSAAELPINVNSGDVICLGHSLTANFSACEFYYCDVTQTKTDLTSPWDNGGVLTLDPCGSTQWTGGVSSSHDWSLCFTAAVRSA